MSLLFLVKIVYKYRRFVKILFYSRRPFFRRQWSAWIYADDTIILVKGLHVSYRILTRNDGDINLIR